MFIHGCNYLFKVNTGHNDSKSLSAQRYIFFGKYAKEKGEKMTNYVV